MLENLNGIGWWEELAKDAHRWYDSCRICKSRTAFPRVSTFLRSVNAARPHTVLIYDMVFVTPKGRRGEIGAVTAICAWSRYLWIRIMWSKSARSVAFAILAIILDCGVVPHKLLSDRGKAFQEKVLLELTSLLGARQGFGLAGAPQGHGLIERPHREIHRELGRAIEAVAELEPEDWPYLMCLPEAMWREKTIEGEVTPFSLRCGFFGSSPLTSALSALAAIPKGVEVTSFMKSVRATHTLLSRQFEEGRAEKKAIMAPYANQHIRPRDFLPGETVLLERLTSDQAKAHKMDANSTGPWKITEVTGDGGAASLENPYTGRALLSGLTGIPDRVTTARLTKVQLPAELAGDEMSLESLRPGQFVAFMHGTHAKLEKISSQAYKGHVKGTLWEVPEEERHGGFGRRPWAQVSDLQELKIMWGDLLCPVKLSETNTIEPASLDLMMERLRGVSAPTYAEPEKTAEGGAIDG